MNTGDPSAIAFEESLARQQLKCLWSLGIQPTLINLAAY